MEDALKTVLDVIVSVPLARATNWTGTIGANKKPKYAADGSRLEDSPPPNAFNKLGNLLRALLGK